MNFIDLVTQSRTCRRFRQSAPVSTAVVRGLVDLGRLAACAGNLQPLKYIISTSPATNAGIFPHLRWAAYLRDWDGPAEGERPAAYIVVCRDDTISDTPGSDHGFATQNILLGATDRGLGACPIGSIDRDGLRQLLHVPDRCEILLVIALGLPAEIVQLEKVFSDTSIRYWRDPAGVHHVPKRSLEEIILSEFTESTGAA